MKKKNNIQNKSKLKKRIVSFATALAVGFASLPLSSIPEQIKVFTGTLVAAADGNERRITSVQELADFVTLYNSAPSTYKDYTIKFAFTNSGTSQDFSSVVPMAATEAAAFNGTIEILTDIQFNLTQPMFTYVTDDVEIVDNSGAVKTMTFSRPNPGDKPLFAEHVVQSRSSGDPVEWSFKYVPYSSGGKSYVFDFAGFVGTLDKNAKVNISSIVLNNKGQHSDGEKTANIVANSTNDAGLVCCTMDQGAQLEIGRISGDTDSYDASFSITGSNAAGGLVGRMESGSKLILGRNLENFQAANAAITSSDGYAGGIVGKCVGGIIEKKTQAATRSSRTLNAAPRTLNEDESKEDSNENIKSETDTDLDNSTNNAESSLDEPVPEKNEDKETERSIAAGKTDDEHSEEAISEDSEPGEKNVSDSDVSEDPISENECEDSADINNDNEDGSKNDEEIPDQDSEVVLAERALYDSDPSKYVIKQIIKGKKGAGGIAGYYKTASAASNYTITLSDLYIDLSSGNYKVNGVGACGGAFGEVFNYGTDMTITADENVICDHTEGKPASYGGLIGKYYASAQTLSLTVSTGTGKSIAPKITEAEVTPTYYGGVIGTVATYDVKNGNTTTKNSAYVKINGVTVNSSNANKGSFGGVIGSANEAFIELAGTNAISYSGIDDKKDFAGVVYSLETGVLYLRGTTDLSGAAAISSATSSSGQIVGYRNCGFVFAESGWKLYRSTSGQKVDDIGSWGEVIRFDDTAATPKLKMSDVITLDTANHYVEIAKRSSFKDIANVKDFAIMALNIQHNEKGSSTGVLRFNGGTNWKSSTILSSDMSFKATSPIDLRGTGLTGLTRDNSYNDIDTTSYLEYKGSKNTNGNNSTIILAIGESYGEGTLPTVGDGRIYRHKYNALFAKINGNTINGNNTTYTNLTFSSNSIINVEACAKNMRIGTIASYTEGTVTIKDVKSDVTINHAGTGESFYVGGLIGQVNGSINLDQWSGKLGCKFTGSILGSSSGSSATVGGLIGYMNGSSFTSSIKNATVSGTIKSEGSRDDQKIGGLIGVSGGSGTLTLQKVDVSGLTVDGAATGTSGGLLGYSWKSTNVTFGDGTSTNYGVKISGSSKMKTTAANAAGLVYRTSGYWQVKPYGITIDTASIDAQSASGSFGLLINKGFVDKTAIYLELQQNGFTVSKTTGDIPTSKLDTSNLASGVAVFDELVAYSKFDGKDITDNGQGIVSINTYDGTNDTSKLLKMGSDDTNTGVTYQKQTSFTPASYYNPNTRYYYNLDQYRANTSASDAAKFLIWSVKQYAHSTIQDYFTAGSSSGTALDLRGYSYYPIDPTGSVTISGNVHLYNKEFDTTENGTTCKRKSLYRDNGNVSQHYTMHNSLFRNINKEVTLTVNSLSLDGDVSIYIGNGTGTSPQYCGALVMGKVESDNSTNPAAVKINGLTLNGIRINGVNSDGSNYAPLLINKSGSNASFDIKNVIAGTKKDNNDNTVSVYEVDDIIASSLIGDLGSSTATSVKISFSDMHLDGRNDTGKGQDGLYDVYYTNRSLFSRATLLNSLAYSDNSSYGTYYYKHSDDWNGSNHTVGGVTYGKEITETVENRTSPTDTPANASKQNKYDGDTIFTHPTNHNAAAEYDGFETKYQKYVYTTGDSDDTTHELRVNISSATFSGCGTYNDPYVITKGDDLETIAKIINGTAESGTSYQIIVPSEVENAATAQSTSWCTRSHHTYTSFAKGDSRTNGTWATSDSTPKTLTDEAMAKYLAGAYYQIDKSLTNDIYLSKDYPGLSKDVASGYEFHGVIDGNDKTIVNQSSNPLIASSNGCVVRKLTVTVTPAAAKTLTTNASTAKFQSTAGGCEYYGAVIGQILGGDNIIEKVSVSFGTFSKTENGVETTNQTVISKGSATYAQNVPIGGYVGVVVNGGLIFKDMSSTSHTGITNTQLDGVTMSSQYLYINPIIGRVINGYAVNVTNNYHWSETANERGDTAGVTLKNGTKNYSIADIASNLDRLTITTVESRPTIQFPNAQSMFILSLLTQSSTTANAYTGHLHNADYDEIGTSAASDGDYANVATTTPYLVKNYVASASQTAVSTLTSDTTAYDLSLGGTGENVVWHLPDGFRGIGSIGFNQTADSYMTDRTLSLHRFSGKNNYGSGSAVTIDMNTFVQHYEYGFDNYMPFGNNSGSGTSTGGLGLFNKFRQTNSSEDTDNPDMISELKLSGKVEYYVFNHSAADGSMTYTKTNIEKGCYLHVGGLAGCIGSGATTDTDAINVKTIGIDGLTVNGFESAGGFFGYLKMADLSSGNVEISDITSTATFLISSKRYAGGLIGYFGQGNLSVSGVTITSPNILIYYTGNSRTDFENGAGGIVGYALNNTNNKPIQLSEIQLGALKSESENPSSFSISSRIGYAEDVVFVQTYPGEKNDAHNDTAVAGGLVGRSHTKGKDGSTYSMILTDCKVYNVDVYGHKVGGLLGSDINGDSFIHIEDCKVISDTDEKSQIYGLTIDSKDRGCGGIIGGNSNGGLVVDDCQIKGYILQGRNDTAAVCAWENTGQLTIHNLLIKDVLIKSDYAGSIVGYQNANIEGYNILTDNVQFQDKDGKASLKNDMGYIVGKNYNSIGCTKIVGFSRQNTTAKSGCVVPDRMTGLNSGSSVGNGCASSKTTSYKNGYVIFADYNGTCTDSGMNKTFSTVNASSAFSGTAKSPYVTVNTKKDIDSTQFFTGDGVSSEYYATSAAKDIIDEISSGADANRYQSTGLTSDQLSDLGSLLTTKISSFERELAKANIATDQAHYSGKDFPVLVIDDISSVDDTIKHYIRLLTNTSYSYQTNENKSIYSIEISKWVYDTDQSKFVKQLDNKGKLIEAALKYDTGRNEFKITSTDQDNIGYQFSLLDVQFKNPTGASNTSTDYAYHLYIPVMVEKMLHYEFTARPATGTSYCLDDYPTAMTNLIENLGNPVTVKLTYSYNQNSTEWAKAINNGENVQRNYDKRIILKADDDLFPTDAQMILVDPNGGKDKMYSAAFTSSLLLPDNNIKYLEFNSNNFSGFEVCKMNDLMKVSIDSTATEKNLVEWKTTDGTSKPCTVIINDPADAAYGKKLRLATSTELSNNNITKYAVKVSGWNSSTFNYLDENYYLSIFTKESKTDTNIYHYEIDADESFRDSAYPSARENEGDVTHILLGRLYNNTVTIQEKNTNSVISRSNNYLEAILTANVGFTGSAMDKDIMSYIANNENINIYQTFLVSLNKIAETSSMGIVITPECSYDYKVDGTSIDESEILDSSKQGIYMEFPTEHSIKTELCNKAANWHKVEKDNEDDCKISITSTVKMSYDKYDVESLATQFPESNGSDGHGSVMVGFSNISSKSENGVSSRASANTLDSTGRRLYYMDSITPVKISYTANENSNYKNDGNGNYGQLGINAQPDAEELMNGLAPINTVISYDATDYSLRRKADYLKIEVMLSNKKQGYNSALDIPTYLQNFRMLDKNGNTIIDRSELTESLDPSDPRNNVTVNKDANTHIYTYTIPRSLLKTAGNSDDSYEFEIPIDFEVKSGEGSNFQGKSLEYSNYRVQVQVRMYEEKEGGSLSYLRNSEAIDHIIYTNARIYRDIVTPHTEQQASP